MNTGSKVFCALDTADTNKAFALAEQLKGKVAGLKIGLEFFMANGHEGYNRMVKAGLPIFLDVKLHDIPNTVYGALSSLLSLQPDFVTIHTSGGEAMMRAAADAADKASGKRPKILGVTVLTSMDGKDMENVGQDTDTSRQVKRLALLAKNSGLDGVICSPAEIKLLREACGPDFILMVPGIRPSWSANNDQKRVMTPKEAVEAGATYLVIGRPITGDKSPAEAAERISGEIQDSDCTYL